MSWLGKLLQRIFGETVMVTAAEAVQSTILAEVFALMSDGGCDELELPSVEKGETEIGRMELFERAVYCLCQRKREQHNNLVRKIEEKMKALLLKEGKHQIDCGGDCAECPAPDRKATVVELRAMDKEINQLRKDSEWLSAFLWFLIRRRLPDAKAQIALRQNGKIVECESSPGIQINFIGSKLPPALELLRLFSGGLSERLLYEVYGIGDESSEAKDTGAGSDDARMLKQALAELFGNIGDLSEADQSKK